MPLVLGARSTWSMLRAGDLRARVRAMREAAAALRLHLGAAALATGLLDALAGGPLPAAELAERTGARDGELFAAWLRTAAAAGLVREDGGRWQLTRRGRAMVADELVRAGVEGFAGFHTALYRDLRPVLAGDLRRRDVADEGALIARLSAGFEPFVLGELDRLATELRPRRVVDVGCGAGVHLATVLAAAPGAEGVGIDVDAGAADLAVGTLERWGLSGRSRVVAGDVREVDPADLGGPAELVLLANVVYYVPRGERVALFRRLAAQLAPGGTLLVMTTVAAPSLFSRHFDLLLRAQEGAMELPDGDELLAQLREAGLTPGELRRVAPGDPLVAVRATT